MAYREPVFATYRLEDGERIKSFVWHAPQPWAAMVIVHGLGEHAHRYLQLIDFFNQLGISVMIYDQRAHGHSTGKRGVIPHEDTLLNDLGVVWTEARRLFGALPLLLLGHSLGGAVACLAVAKQVIRPYALMLSSPALLVRMNTKEAITLKLGLKFFPNLTVSNGLHADKLSHDAIVVNDYRVDPMVHDKISPRLAQMMLTAHDVVVQHANQFTMPTLMQVAGSDEIIDAQGSKNVYEALKGNEHTRLFWYDDYYHEIFNEDNSRRPQVLADLKAWLDHLKRDGH